MRFVEQACRILKKEFPNLRTPLVYEEPYQLCVAVILSAQCTDLQVNRISPKLFAAYPSPQALAYAPIGSIEKLIYSTGFYKNKAQQIRGFCKMLVEDFDKQVPSRMEDLLRMPGVGRKTANVIMQELYRKTVGIVVDTHVARISRIFHLTRSTNPMRVEKDLMEKLEKKYWLDWSLLLIFLGRKYCKARRPMCRQCVLSHICPSSQAHAVK